MKRLIFVLTLCAGISAVYAMSTADALRQARKLLGDSQIEDCSICAEDLSKRSVKLLDQYFVPGMIIKVSDGTYFMKTDECENNEFVLSSQSGRETYIGKNDKRGELPLVTYRIHTENDHLAGAKKEDYTSLQNARPFMKINSKKDWRGTGELVLILYPYGDGKCFIYFQKQRKIQFQCKVAAVQNTAAQ